MKPLPNVEPATDRLPSQTVRTVATLLLFVHLFALLAAVASNPQDGMASRLLARLGNVRFLSAYTEALWMESAYDFFYTYFHTFGNNEFVLALSTDHQFEAELTFADGRTEAVHIPDDSRFPRMRDQRYKNLGNAAARYVGQQGAESLVPAALAESLLRSAGAETVKLSLKRRTLQTMDAVNSSSASSRDPYDPRYSRVIYTGFAQLRNGRVDYRKVEDAGGAAPGGGTSGATPPASSAPPPTSTAPPPATTAPPPSRSLRRDGIPNGR